MSRGVGGIVLVCLILLVGVPFWRQSNEPFNARSNPCKECSNYLGADYIERGAQPDCCYKRPLVEMKDATVKNDLHTDEIYVHTATGVTKTTQDFGRDVPNIRTNLYSTQRSMNNLKREHTRLRDQITQVANNRTKKREIVWGGNRYFHELDYVEQGEMKIYKFMLEAAHEVVITTESNADMDLYVLFGGAPPTKARLLRSELRRITGSGNETLVYRSDRAGPLYIGVYGYRNGSYTFRVTATSATG